MTVDERIERLVEANENMSARMVDVETSQQKTQLILAQIVEQMAQVSQDIKKLGRIAGVLLINDEELDRRLTELEGRAPRKPQ